MSKRPVLTAIAAAAVLASGTASAQLLGGDGGLLGGGGGAVGGTVDGLGGATGALSGPAGALGGPVGGLGGALQGVGGGLGTLAGSVERVGTNGPNNFGGLGLTESELVNSVEPALLLEDVYQPQISQSDAEALARIRKLRHEMLILAYKNVLDRDPDGQPVRKRELVAVDPDPASLGAAVRAGFRVVGDERPLGLGLRMLTLACPNGLGTREGLRKLRKVAPKLNADFNHVYEPAGGALLPAMGAKLATALHVRPGTRIAMIDGGVASHPSLARANVEQRGFAGAAQPTGHGTAVGSLLVGTQGPFKGAARGAQLFVGDVYGGNPAAGSATIIVRALAWAASKQPRVVNISL